MALQAVRRVSLRSDAYSPMDSPHGLPALHWPNLVGDLLRNEGVDVLEDRLRQIGWDPQWRFGMYRQAHYHSTTHELLTVVQGYATIQLGGTDKRAHPPNVQQEEQVTQTTIELRRGDVLLLPAGYTHRAVESHDGFTMAGSYPHGGTQWDMRFPNVNGCQHDSDKIRSLIQRDERKALYRAQDPTALLSDQTTEQSNTPDALQTHWFAERSNPQ